MNAPSGVGSRRTILFVERYGMNGGAQAVLRDLVQRLDAERFRAVVVCLAPGELVEELRSPRRGHLRLADKATDEAPP